MSLTDNELLSLARFHHFSKKALLKKPDAYKTVLPALHELDKNYFDNLSADNLKSEKYQSILHMQAEMKRLGQAKRLEHCKRADSEGSDVIDEGRFKTETRAVKHEAPVQHVDMASSTNGGSAATRSATWDEDSTRNTTSAEQISSLLQSQKMISSQELENERRHHLAATERMATLTEILKETTLEMNRNIVLQNMDLDQIQTHAVNNLAELDEQRKQLSQRQKAMSIGFWTSIYAYFLILVLFLVTYLIIRLFPAYPSN